MSVCVQSQPRNLLEEMEANHPSKRLKASPKAPPGAPSAKAIIQATKASQLCVSPQGIMITVDNETADAAVMSDCKVTCEALSVVPGLYWLLPVNFNGRSVWKQEVATGPASGPLLLMYYEAEQDAGWYICSDVLETMQAAKVGDVKIYAWCGDNELPTKAHVPYWQKKCCKGIKITTYIDHLIQVHHEYVQDTQHITECFPVQPASAAPPAAPAGEVGDHDQPDAEGMFHNKGVQNRGGWMPKMKMLMVAYWKKQWVKCDTLLDVFYHESPVLKKLVDADLRKGKYD